MNAEATALLVIAVVLAVLDWVAVARGDTRLEYAAKPGATLALAAMAATMDAAHTDTQALFVLALLASLAGDVFLMLPGDRLVPGLASFLVAQLLYTAGFVLHGGGVEAYVVGAVIAGAIVVPLALRFVRALRRSDRDALVVPVIVYMVAFVASDSLIAETRFVRPRAWGPVAIMVTYHVALVGLVLSLL
jgi:uncharacterized membrane protein YhhN